jgi:hypothetical protein
LMRARRLGIIRSQTIRKKFRHEIDTGIDDLPLLAPAGGRGPGQGPPCLR